MKLAGIAATAREHQVGQPGVSLDGVANLPKAEAKRVERGGFERHLLLEL